MKSLVSATALLLATQPIAAQTLAVLLPSIPFSEPTVTVGTNDCATSLDGPICQIDK